MKRFKAKPGVSLGGPPGNVKQVLPPNPPARNPWFQVIWMEDGEKKYSAHDNRTTARIHMMELLAKKIPAWVENFQPIWVEKREETSGD